MILVRADGNAKTGAGHLMRCAAIMEEAAKMRGREEILFVCADGQSAALAERAGFRVLALHTDYRDMEAELPLWNKITHEIDNPGENVILVDSYYATNAYLAGLRPYGRVYLMDDMAEEAFDVTGVINYNAFADSGVYERLYAGRDTRLWIGSSYVPVREEFLDRQYSVGERVENVLITTGGGDSENIAYRILETLQGYAPKGDTEVCYHLIVGQYNPHYGEMRELEKTHDGIRIHHDVADMSGLMLQCDLAVTAGGTTVYELAALGVPFLCFSYAGNQEALTEYIGRKGIAGFCGAYHREPERVLARMGELFGEYCDNRELRVRAHIREKEMIDGLGAKRLAKVLWEEEGK